MLLAMAGSLDSFRKERERLILINRALERGDRAAIRSELQPQGFIPENRVKVIEPPKGN